MTALQRYGNGLIDNLTYTLNGYLLTKVEDATGNAAGFSNGASTSNEYTYDVNGNLTKDSNKGIASISYNSLNLPSVVTFSDGSTITYLYTADGRKLRTTHVINGTTTTTDYCGNVIYEGTTPKKLLTDEGYVDLTTATPTYYYYLKDHQGNNRVVINADEGDAVEVNHYYPFGGLFSTSTNVQPYKYNGKELDTKKGLNWYDYGARHYDAVLGRFTTQDRFAEKYSPLSPYQYGANSPINVVDINGDSLKILSSDLITAIYHGLKDGNKIQMKFSNGILDPTSIKDHIKNSDDLFLKDLYEIASSSQMVEMYLDSKNTYLLNGIKQSEYFSAPYDDNDDLLTDKVKMDLRSMGIPVGKHVNGNLGQTLVPNLLLPSGKNSTNNNVQIIINSKGNLNHRTIGIAHEFGHVILYLRNQPFSHGQPGVNSFIDKRSSIMSKRLGYEY
ncbi:MAG: RHS repeat-associated core domain-containing protein [Mediterranea massiliensis]|nr:RHS repeat-associated core domain-containing protein [Mediterranea massiliensis]